MVCPFQSLQTVEEGNVIIEEAVDLSIRNVVIEFSALVTLFLDLSNIFISKEWLYLFDCLVFPSAVKR